MDRDKDDEVEKRREVRRLGHSGQGDHRLRPNLGTLLFWWFSVTRMTGNSKYYSAVSLFVWLTNFRYLNMLEYHPYSCLFKLGSGWKKTWQWILSISLLLQFTATIYCIRVPILGHLRPERQGQHQIRLSRGPDRQCPGDFALLATKPLREDLDVPQLHILNRGP
jgi:hypothetical protein